MTSDNYPLRSAKFPQSQRWIIWCILAALVCLIISLPFWTGKWYWRSVQNELVAKGERLFPKDFQRTAVPDPVNYFAIPFFKEAVATGGGSSSASYRLDKVISSAGSRLFGRPIRRTGAENARHLFNMQSRSTGGFPPANAAISEEELQELERILDPWGQVRRDLLSEAGRPASGGDLGKSSVDILPGVVRLASWLCRLHSILALSEKDGTGALEDIVILERLSRALAPEPMSESFWMAREAWAGAADIIREGMFLWSDEELVKLAEILDRPPFAPKDFTQSLRSERAALNGDFRDAIERGTLKLAWWGPLPRHMRQTGYFPWANFNLTSQELIEYLEKPDVKPSDFLRIKQRLAGTGMSTALHNHLHMFELFYFETILNMIRELFANSDYVRMTSMAVALERYDRKYGGIPANLDGLVPEFLAEIPGGSFFGQKIHYLPETDGGYKLWTEGWNETDEGGVPGDDTGDWTLERNPRSKTPNDRAK